MTLATEPTPKQQTFTSAVKWFASIVQIVGYGLTGFGVTPWNLYMFLIGVFGWFLVGWLWRDRAIMLVHVVALAAMIAGMVG